MTEANLNGHGSITRDPDLCEEAGILPMEFIEIWNKNSCARISIYVIFGEGLQMLHSTERRLEPASGATS